MAYETGGLANKLGNRFEKRWVVSQLLQLIAGRIRSLQYEPVGPDEAGVDLWVEKLDGGREAQQCKGESGTESEWSMADLNRLRVLEHLSAQLARDANHEFALISATAAVIFRDLSRSARDSENAQSFWENQVLDRSKKHRNEFAKFCEYLHINCETPDGLEKAHDLLRRSHYHPFSDDLESQRQLEMVAGFLASGAPDRVLDALSSFADSEGNFRRKIFADEVAEYLQEKGHPPRELSRDSRLPPLVKGLRNAFMESLSQHLAAGRLIPRAETRSLLAWVDSPGKEQMLVLDGPAGVGKSGVLYEFASALQSRGIPFLPLRLDRQPPAGNPRRYGEERGLPDSPAFCLQAVAGDRRAVLILDQVDALRWTSAHSSEAFPICHEMIRQTMDLGRNLLVVVSCRTFDLDNDPQIKIWKDKIVSRRVRVELLSDSVIRDFVESLGVAYSSLSGRERQLLGNIQNLTMWSEIVTAYGEHIGFSTVTELSKQFWVSRWQELTKRGVPRAEVVDFLESVTEYMEENSRLDAPERKAARYLAAATELQSLNVIQVADQRITFCHQNYLDYQVSQRLLERIDKGSDSVITWLGGRPRQSLFRREQLRLVLNRLRDEDPGRFLRTMRELLASDAIRFHLKQVAIQCLGHIDDPSPDEVDLAIELFRHDDWRNHVGDFVVVGNPTWFGHFDDRGEWRNAVASGDRAAVALPLSLMRSVAEQCGERVARLLTPCLERGGDGPYWCANVMPFDATKDSDELFELRLRLPLPGNGHDIVFLPQVARQRPDRCIRLLATYIRREIAAESSGDGPTRYRTWSDELDHFQSRDLVALWDAGTKQPQLAWDVLWPAVVDFVQVTAETHPYRVDYDGLPKPLFQILVAGGGKLLRVNAADFLRKIDLLDGNAPRCILSTVLAALFRGPADMADQILQWVMARPACLRSGDRDEISQWEPARKVIHRHTRRCSEETYRQLESFLMRYHDDDEKRSFGRRREWAQENWRGIPNLWGQTQYHLLSALPDRRKSIDAKGLQGVLGRKFDPHTPDMFQQPPRFTSGYLTSPIDESTERSMSDAAWVGIITRRARDRRGTLRYQSGRLTGSSPEQLAQNLSQATFREPDRFAGILLRIPRGANPAYYAAILESLSFKTPPQNLGKEDQERRNLPGIELLEPAVIRTLARNEPDHMRALCRMLREFNDLDWPIGVIETVVTSAARLVDPPPIPVAQANAREEGPPSVQILESQSISCIRGDAAWTVKDLLWADIGRLSVLRPVAEMLLTDDEAAVRVAALAICGPVWNVDRECAANWFCLACEHPDERIMASRASRRLLPFIQRSHPALVRPIVLRMIVSGHPEVAEAGAAHATVNWIMHGDFRDEVSTCRTGNSGQRRGVALAAADLLLNASYTEASIEILRPLLDDGDDKVRTHCERVFHHADAVERPDLKPFFESYVRSLAFRRNQRAMMYALKNLTGSLVPFAELLMGIIEVFAGPLANASRDYSTRTAYDISEIFPLMVRLYEQAESRNDIRQRCLDAWDILLQQRVGTARQLTESIRV